MARWNNLEDSTIDARTIYVGAYGWTDNDALGHIWARTERQFEQMARSVMSEEARRAFSGEFDTAPEYRKTFGEIRDNLWYVGPFAQTVGETVESLEESSRGAEFRDDIRTSTAGYVY